MTGSARLVVFAHAALAALSLVAWWAVRPPPPERLAGRSGPLALAGRWAYWVTRPLLGAARALRLSPDAVTALGVAVTVVAGWLAARGEWGLAGVALLWGSVCDMLDGELARSTGTVTPAGAFLDSNLDRVAEMALLGGVAWGLPWREGSAWAVAALCASLMVSYARARGEGLGVACPAFGLERPHRLVILLAALLVAPFLSWRGGVMAVEVAVVLVAVGAGATAAARVVVIRRALRAGGGGPPPGR